MKKIIFITSTISQPRVIKRIQTIYEAGFSIKVYGFDRNVYNCNKLPDFFEFEQLGNMKDGADYLNKISQFKKAISFIIHNHKEEDVIYYSFSIISAFFLMRNNVNYVYELSDLLYGYPKFNIVRPICKLIDKLIIRNSLLTVMTSQGFKEYLYKHNEIENIIVQPNKLNSYFKSIDRPHYKIINAEHINFGFVGAIRYKDTILRFAKIIGKYFPQHNFFFYGDSSMIEEFKNETLGYDNIYFYGAFKNPQDLDSIYSKIDIVVACYETNSLNERIAEPNKLFESAYFIKPIIVSKNSFLERQVDRIGCGFVIDAYSDISIKNFIENLAEDSIKKIQRIEKEIPSDDLIDNPQEIIKYLKNAK